MNWPLVIILVVVVSIVLGPILYVMPTPRDRQQGRLREHARSIGLNVQARSIPHPDPDPADRVNAGGKLLDSKLEAMAYVLPLKHERALEARHLPRWRVVRVREGGGSKFDGLPDDWRLDKSELSLRQAVIDELTGLLEAMPKGTLAVEANSGSCLLYWKELGGPEEVDAVKAVLERVADFQLRLGRAAQAEARRKAGLD